jgi:hypothetical protein
VEKLPKIEQRIVPGRNAPVPLSRSPIQNGFVIGIHSDLPARGANYGYLPDGRTAAEAHHFMMFEWIVANFPGATRDNTPSVIVRTELHDLTRGLWNAIEPSLPHTKSGAVAFTQISEAGMKELGNAYADIMGMNEAAKKEMWDTWEKWKANYKAQKEMEDFQREHDQWVHSVDAIDEVPFNPPN